MWCQIFEEHNFHRLPFPKILGNIYCVSRGAALDLLPDLKCDSNGEDFKGANNANMCRNAKRRFSTEAMVHGCHVHEDWHREDER